MTRTLVHQLHGRVFARRLPLRVLRSNVNGNTGGRACCSRRYASVCACMYPPESACSAEPCVGSAWCGPTWLPRWSCAYASNSVGACTGGFLYTQTIGRGRCGCVCACVCVHVMCICICYGWTVVYDRLMYARAWVCRARARASTVVILQGVRVLSDFGLAGQPGSSVWWGRRFATDRPKDHPNPAVGDEGFPTPVVSGRERDHPSAARDWGE